MLFLQVLPPFHSPLRLSHRSPPARAKSRDLAARPTGAIEALSGDQPATGTGPRMAPQTTPVSRHGRLLLIGALGFGLAACASNERPEADLAAAQVTAIGVNSYLWRATLETLSFMPLTQADSSGGVIVTDWYSNPQNPNERVKLSVSILDQDLRA